MRWAFVLVAAAAALAIAACNTFAPSGAEGAGGAGQAARPTADRAG